MLQQFFVLTLFVVIACSIPSPWFKSNSAWNVVLPDDVPLSPNSDELVAGLVHQVKAYTPWINVESYSVPVYTVPENQPTKVVNLINPDTTGCVEQLRKAYQTVPIPDNAQPAAGTDKHLAIWQPSTDTMWEFWAMEMNTTTHEWQARWGGKMNNVKSNPGFYTLPCTYWGATATSLALVGGLLLIDEIKSGVIEHALPMALVNTKKGTWVAPAERGDGWSTSTDAVPEGTRFRIPANLNITALNLHPFADMMARAMQKYGGLVRDTAGATVAAYCEPPPPNTTNPYTGPNGFFKGLYPNQVLNNFPWDKMQVVDPTWQPWNNDDELILNK